MTRRRPTESRSAGGTDAVGYYSDKYPSDPEILLAITAVTMQVFGKRHAFLGA